MTFELWWIGFGGNVLLLVLLAWYALREKKYRNYFEEKLGRAIDRLRKKNELLVDKEKQLQAEQALFADLVGKNKRLSGSLETAQNKVLEWKGLAESRADEINAVRADREDLKKEIADQKETIQKLDVQNSRMHGEIRTLKENVESMQKERNRAVEDAEEIDRQRTDLIEDKETLSDSVKAFKAQNELHTKRIKQLEENYAHLCGQFDALQIAFDQNKNKLTQTEKQLTKAKKSKNMDYKKRYLDYTRKFASARSSVKRLEKERDQLKQNIKDMAETKNPK